MKEEQTITELPKGWKEIQLGKACEKISLNGIKIKQKDYLAEGKYPVVDQGQDLIGGYFNDDKLLVPNEPPYIIFGDHTRVKKYITFKFVAGADGVKVLKPSSDFNPKFFYYSLYTVNIPDKGYARHFQFLDKALIPVPPKETQQQIVSKIEELFSELDKGIEELKTAQQQLKVYRQAVLKWAFEGKLTNEWRNNNPSVEKAYDFLSRIKEKRKTKFKESGNKADKNYDFDIKQNESISSWATGTLDKLIYIAGRIGWRGLTKDEYTSEGPLFLSVHALNYGKYVEYKDAYHVSRERYLESPEIMLAEKDILLCKDGAGIGKIGIIKNLPSEATVNSSLLVIRGLEVFVPEFLFYLFSGPALQLIVRERITGSATPHLFQNDIRKFELQIPPKEEQQQIVQEIESRLSVCDKIAETITDSLKQAEALRQSILNKAFEGKLI